MSDTVFNKVPITGLSPVDASVREQLKVRSELFSKSYSDPDFTQHYINSNYAFLRVSSGIEIEGKPEESKKYQLLGGTLFNGNKARRGLNFEGQNFNDDAQGNAYTFEKEGIVPMPGITSFNLETTGNNGLLRMASLSIQCHSIEQFSALEKLYMRPGFKLCFEWGHSTYIDKSGNKVYSPKTLSNDTLFGSSKNLIETIKEEAGKLIFDSQHNYDYMVGTIMNYEWSYDNGVYSIEVQAQGEGGLSASQARMFKVGTESDTNPDEEGKKELEFDSADKLEGSFTTILKTITEAAGRGRQSEDAITPIKVDQSRIDDALEKRKVKEFVDAISSELGNGFKLEVYKLDFKANKDKQKFTYIPFKFIIGCINHFFLPKFKDDPAPAGKFNTDPGINTYLTFEDHFSTDPFICLLPNQSSSTPLETSALKGNRDNAEFKGDLLDIWVNTHHVYEVAKAIMKAKNKPTVAVFIDLLLSKMQTAMGGINDFGLYNDYYADKELGPSRIRDKQLPTDDSIKDQETVIKSLGKESYVNSLSFNTNIDQSTLNAMTTQAVLSGTDAAKSLHRGVSAYSKGLKDRYGKDKETENITNSTDKPEDQKKSVEQTYKQIYEKKVYNQDSIDKIKYAANDVQSIRLSEVLNKGGKHIGFAIPGNINLTMKGIGGIKMLQYFRLPYDNLPSSYKETEVVFMTTNISHQIDGGVWFTEIQAQVQII